MCSIPGVAFGDLAVAAMPEELERLFRAAEAARARALAGLAVFDAHGAAGVDGLFSTQSWLRHRLQMTNAEAKQHVDNARVSRDHRAVGEAHAAGRLTGRQLGEIGRAAGRLAQPVMAGAAPMLVDLAQRFDSRVLRAAVGRIESAVTGDAAVVANEADADLFGQRSLHVSRTFDGMVRVDADLDPQNGSLFLACLEALAGPRDAGALRDAGDAGDAGPDVRTRSQRNADALAEICTRVLAGGDLPSTGGQKPHVTLVVDVATLTAYTGDGMGTRSALSGLFEFALGPDAARRISCDSAVDTVVVDPVGVPLALGRAARTVSPGQHKTLRVRDNGCVFPGCNRPHSWCQAHHVIHWSQGGLTNSDNLVMLCNKHHTSLHAGGWDISRIPNSDSRFRWHPPDGREPIPAQHATDRDPLTTLDFACAVARLRARADEHG